MGGFDSDDVRELQELSNALVPVDEPGIGPPTWPRFSRAALVGLGAYVVMLVLGVDMASRNVVDGIGFLLIVGVPLVGIGLLARRDAAARAAGRDRRGKS